MYEKYFGITVKPFSIAPDPSFLYMSPGHREALAHLRYGLENDGGFVLLTGEVGTGKTTVCRCLLEHVPDDADIAYILNPKVTVVELLETICDELEIKRPLTGTATIKGLVDLLNDHLLKTHGANRRTVLIIDEAQNLDNDVLEQIRLLTNLETNQQKLLQIILLGQPELHEKLKEPGMRQLSQRVSARHHLGPLSRNETRAYVTHRLSVAGLNRQVFTGDSIKKLFKLSGGIPRLINMIGDRALLGAFSKEKRQVDGQIVEKAAREVFGEKIETAWQLMSISSWKVAALMVIFVSFMLAVIKYSGNPQKELSTDGAALETVKQIVNGQGQAEAKVGPDGAVVSERFDQAVWPKGEAAAVSEDIAYVDLFKLWGVTYEPNGHWPCQFAEQNKLFCLSKQGSIKSLISLNRPAVLLMRHQDGEEFYALMVKLEGSGALFKSGEASFKLPLAAIAQLWTGYFTILWKPPPGYQDSIRPGRRGSDVAWLSEQLASIFAEQGADWQGSEIYDEEISRAVKKFQFDNGLLPDGIAGKETLIMVNSKSGSNVPLLNRAEL